MSIQFPHLKRKIVLIIRLLVWGISRAVWTNDFKWLKQFSSLALGLSKSQGNVALFISKIPSTQCLTSCTFVPLTLQIHILHLTKRNPFLNQSLFIKYDKKNIICQSECRITDYKYLDFGFSSQSNKLSILRPEKKKYKYSAQLKWSLLDQY